MRETISEEIENIWEKIFVRNTSDKGLLSRIYEELLKLHNKKKIKM